jgi:hypothetical protein
MKGVLTKIMQDQELSVGDDDRRFARKMTCLKKFRAIHEPNGRPLLSNSVFKSRYDLFVLKTIWYDTISSLITQEL